METNTNFNTSNFWANLFKTETTKDDLEGMVCSIPPFSQIEKKYIKHLMKLLHNRAYKSGEYIFMEGDPGIGLYLVQEGEVNILKEFGDGKVEELATFGKGDFFGELSTLFEDERSASAIAVEDTKLAVIFRPDLDEFINKYPKQGIIILRGLTHIVITRLRHINDDYVALKKQLLNKNKELQNAADKENFSPD